MFSIIYKGITYPLTDLDSRQLSLELEELDFYGFGEVERKTEWIIYRFLKSKNFKVTVPKRAEPMLMTDLFDIGRSEGAAPEVQRGAIKKVYSSRQDKEQDDQAALKGALWLFLIVVFFALGAIFFFQIVIMLKP